MSLEQAIQENTDVLKQFMAVLQTTTAALGNLAASAEVTATHAPLNISAEPEKKTRTRKEKPADTGASADQGNAAAMQQQTAASEPSATQQQATASAAPSAPAPAPEPEKKPSASFADVTAKIIELNKSQKPGHGRDGVLAVLAHFLGDATGKRVPDLEALGKNDEIIAFTDSLLTAPAAADDLGI